MKAMTLAAMVPFTSLAMTAQNNTHFVQHQDGLFAMSSSFNGTESLFLDISRGTDASTGEPTT